jgi:hypothetical protein
VTDDVNDDINTLSCFLTAFAPLGTALDEIFGPAATEALESDPSPNNVGFIVDFGSFGNVLEIVEDVEVELFRASLLLAVSNPPLLDCIFGDEGVSLGTCAAGGFEATAAQLIPLESTARSVSLNTRAVSKKEKA